MNGRYGPIQLEYATCVTDCGSGANWQVGAGVVGPEPTHPNLVRDPAGQLHVAYENLTSSTVGYAE